MSILKFYQLLLLSFTRDHVKSSWSLFAATGIISHSIFKCSVQIGELGLDDVARVVGHAQNQVNAELQDDHQEGRDPRHHPED